MRETYQDIIDEIGANRVAKNMRMNRVEIPENWEVNCE